MTELLPDQKDYERAMQSKIEVVERIDVVRALTPKEMSDAMQSYLEVQQVIDRSMPDMIMDIQGKKFRKKGYWRAVRVAFNLSLDLVSEKLETIKEDWGYVVTYRATAPNGVSSIGDGSCFASEKVDRYGKPTKMQTVHNVRSHAHTRAQNRAISNLVGFGEVSAEEINFEEERQKTLVENHTKAVDTAKEVLGVQEKPIVNSQKWAKDIWTWFAAEGGTREQFQQLKTESYIEDLRAASHEEQVRFAEAVKGFVSELRNQAAQDTSFPG